MKVLVRLPNWLGDVVMSTAFIKAAIQSFPDAQLDVIIKAELAQLAAFIPNVNHIYTFSKKDYKGITGAYRFGKVLRNQHYDIFFSLPDSFSSAIIAWVSKATYRIGYKTEGRSLLLTNSYQKPAQLHRVDEYIYLLEQFTQTKILHRSVGLSYQQDTCKQNLVLVNFNSEAVSRRMPQDKAIQILQALLISFPHYTIGLLGSPKENSYVNQLISKAGNPKKIINYAGKTDLTQLVKLILSAKAVLSTDSGPAHLTNSLNIPLVVLFGAGNEANTAPYNKEKLHVICLGELPCEPCVKNTCIYGSPKCLELLETQKIITPLNLYLQV